MAFAPLVIGGVGKALTAKVLMATAIGTTVAGTVISAGAASQAGKTEQAWQEYNAAISEQQATATKEAATHEEKAHRKAGERHLARMRALYGKAGLSITEGTPLLTLKETAGEIEKDALMIRRGGTMGEQRLISQAGMERAKGKFARRAGRWRTGATLLSGGSRIAELYGRGKGYW